MTDRFVFVLEVEGEVDEPFSNELRTASGAELRAVKKHGLTGDVSSWLLVGNFVVSSIATITPLIAGYLKDRRVKSVKLGDLVIENPTSEQVESVLRSMSR